MAAPASASAAPLLSALHFSVGPGLGHFVQLRLPVEDGHTAAAVVPPEMVFVVDISGSMVSLAQCLT